ncbi:MAG: 16S rRNA (guanine(527)-N(7))-methyltransferase RsmG [Burkholderiaceae bacterium]
MKAVLQPEPDHVVAQLLNPRASQPAARFLSAGKIAAAAQQIGIPLSRSQSDSLAAYATLLLRWNSVHNLTAIESPAEVLTHHLLDSLSIVPEIRRITAVPARVIDVGAGGGLPGIPLAIAAPDLHVTLVDKVEKKVAFLIQTQIELGLRNLECVHARVEALRPKELYDVVIARAFAALPDLVRMTRQLVAKRGWWCAMKGAVPYDELAALKVHAPDVRVMAEIRLRVPNLDAERHLILLQFADTSD